MSTLFELPPPQPQLFEMPPLPDATCRTCRHRERWQCGGTVIMYCNVIKSNRTQNGLKKIKVTNSACIRYERKTN